MLQLNKLRINAEYQLFKDRAKILVQNEQFDDALSIIDVCARIGYNLNFRFFDEDLEQFLVNIGLKLLHQSGFDQSTDRFVFYDYFGLDNRGLTQQYIRALMSMGANFLYIREESVDFVQGGDILNEVQNYLGAEVYLVKGVTYIEKITEVAQVISDYRPSRAFLHLSPWDVVGVCVWSRFPQVERYFINITDHAFWLGKSCFDYCVEFRSYGYHLSIEARRICSKKLLLLPYYPIQADNAFQGFPIDVNNKVVGFSGSAYYKIYGRDSKFMHLIKRVLDENPDFIFLMAGSGDERPLLKFIAENGLNDRFILIGNRRDINQVIKRIDIFINTFPFIGGLMTHLAIVNKKPVVSFSSPDLPVNFIEDFLNVERQKVYSFKEERAFLDEVGRLIREPVYREENVKMYQKSIPTCAEFNSNFKKLCYSPDSLSKPQGLEAEIDYDAIFELYLEVENKYVQQLQLMKLSLLKGRYFRYFPFNAIISVGLVIMSHPQMVFSKVIFSFRDKMERLIRRANWSRL